MEDSVFYVGMDLGTFKTSVTSSNGQRETMLTAVGWPKDHIARAMLGRDVVFGDDIVWNDSRPSQLWRYHLHYFNYVNELIVCSKIDEKDGNSAAIFTNIANSWIILFSRLPHTHTHIKCCVTMISVARLCLWTSDERKSSREKRLSSVYSNGHVSVCGRVAVSIMPSEVNHKYWN